MMPVRCRISVNVRQFQSRIPPGVRGCSGRRMWWNIAGRKSRNAEGRQANDLAPRNSMRVANNPKQLAGAELRLIAIEAIYFSSWL